VKFNEQGGKLRGANKRLKNEAVKGKDEPTSGPEESNLTKGNRGLIVGSEL